MQIRHFLVKLRDRAWYVALGMFLAAASSYFVARQLPPVYEAHATLLVDVPSASDGQAETDVAASQELARQLSELVIDRVVLEHAATTLGSSVTAEQLERAVAAQPILDSQYVAISARGADPVLVRDIARSVAETFVDQPWLHHGPAVVSLVRPPLLPSSPADDAPIPLVLGLAAAVGLLLTGGATLASRALDDGHNNA